MARTVELRFQKFFGNRKRINEIDPRFFTRDLINPKGKISIKGVIKFPYKFLRTIAAESLYEIWRHTSGKGIRIKEPIFLIGMPHSGTTIAMKLFARHPDVVNKSEAHTILQPMGYFDWGNGDHVLTEKDATPEEGERLHVRFGFYTWLYRKKRFFNKCPNNAVRIPFLTKIFPNAYFLHMFRDGRAVVNSLLGSLPTDRNWEIGDRFKPWREREEPFPGVRPPDWRSLLRDNPLEQHALQWREVISYSLRDQKKYNILCFRYEDLCENPRKIIEKLWRFCHLPVTKDILERLPEKLENRNYKWQKSMTEEQKGLVTTIQEPLLKRLGYLK